MQQATTETESDDLPKETIKAFDGDTLAARTFVEKYALRDEEGNLIETRPQEMWRRVAREIASVEQEPDFIRQEFEWLLNDFRFVPGGRILHGAGAKHHATLLNCYFKGIEEDSIEGIFDWAKYAARTYATGGGMGVCIGPLRPEGANVNNTAKTSSGAWSFSELFSTTTGVIGQHGRRGALMITCPVDHPDVEEFIKMKGEDLDSVRYANISIKLTDEFMHAVENGESFTLRWEDEDKNIDMKKVVDARSLWDEIVTIAHASAEPGLLMWDNIKEGSPTEYCAPVEGTNPCSEQPLESGGACCLGHVNLARLVDDPFTDDAEVRWDEMRRVVRSGVRFLDDVLDYNMDLHPHDDQRDQSQSIRRIGLGVTGLADMMAKLKIKYDTQEAVQFVDEVMEQIKLWAYDESVDLAMEKEPFPEFDAEEHLNQSFIQDLPSDLRTRIQEHGLRNACILTVAPVGSGSVIAQTSSGVEPIYQLKYQRRSESLSEEFHEVEHHLVQEWRDETGKGSHGIDIEDDVPDYFVTSHDIDPFFRVKLQATMQDHVDSAISSTINLPRDIDVDTVKDIYMDAWKQGCKGVTVYREGAREGILISEEETEDQVQNEPQYEGEGDASSNGHKKLEPEQRPDRLDGTTYKVTTPQGNAYITVTEYEGEPFEVFCNISRSGAYTQAFSEALARLISLHLRSGGDMADIIDQLVGIRGPDVAFSDDGRVFSVPDALGKALDKHVEGVIDDAEKKRGAAPECSQCGQPMVFEEGCQKCKSCGSSKC